MSNQTEAAARQGDADSSREPGIALSGVGSDQALARVLRNIDRLGLNEQLIQLETEGYVVLRGVLSELQVERTKAAILKRAEAHAGKRISLDTATADDFANMAYLPYMLYDDEVFEEVLMQERPLALMTYLLGESCLLSSIGCHFKGMGEMGALPLHSDNGNGIPQPFPHYSLCANINYALTPYSQEGGALAIVPGSHRLARNPTIHEMALTGEHANPNAIPVNLEPGDAVVWHGNTWHGSYPRRLPGIRVNLALLMARQFVATQEHHRGVVPRDVLERHANNERFLTLVAGKQPYGWGLEGPDYEVMGRSPRGYFD